MEKRKFRSRFIKNLKYQYRLLKTEIPISIYQKSRSQNLDFIKSRETYSRFYNTTESGSCFFSSSILRSKTHRKEVHKTKD